MSCDASCHWRPHLLCGSCEDLEQPAIWSRVGIIFVHVQAPAQVTFYQKLSRQLPPHLTKRFRHVPRILSFSLTLLGVLAVILTLCHVNQFFAAAAAADDDDDELCIDCIKDFYVSWTLWDLNPDPCQHPFWHIRHCRCRALGRGSVAVTMVAQWW